MLSFGLISGSLYTCFTRTLSGNIWFSPQTALLIVLFPLSAQAHQCRQYFPTTQGSRGFLSQIPAVDSGYLKFWNQITEAPKGAKNERVIEAQLRAHHITKIHGDQMRLEKAIRDKNWEEVKRLISFTDADLGNWGPGYNPNLLYSSPFEAIYRDPQGRKKLGLWLVQHPKFTNALRNPDSDFKYILQRLISDTDTANRDWDILKEVTARADINSSGGMEAASPKSYRSPLLTAIERGDHALDRNKDVPLIELVLTRKDIDFTKTDENGNGALALMFKVRLSSELILKYINDLRFPINQFNNNGKSILDYAVDRDDVRLIQAILSRPDFNPLAKNNGGQGTLMGLFSSFHFAKFYRFIDTYILRAVAQKDFDINEVDAWGTSILDYALSTGDRKFIETVLNHPDFDLKKHNTHRLGRNKILYRQEYNQYVLEAIDSGLDVTARDDKNETFLIQAIRARNLVVIKKIIERADAPLTLPDRQDRDAFIHSVENKLTDAIRLLWPKYSYAQKEYYKALYLKKYRERQDPDLHDFFSQFEYQTEGN